MPLNLLSGFLLQVQFLSYVLYMAAHESFRLLE